MVDRTDEETAELIREWLQQNGLSIIAGLVIGVGILFGYQWWQERQVEQKSARSATIETLNQALDEQRFDYVLTTVDKMAQDGEEISGFTALLAAKAAIDSKQTDKAISYLQQAKHSQDELLAQTASYRLAQIYVGQKDYESAQSEIIGLQDSAYQGQAALLEGYIYQSQQHNQEALEAYRRSLTLLPSATTEILVNTLEAKLLIQQTES